MIFIFTFGLKVNGLERKIEKITIINNSKISISPFFCSKSNNLNDYGAAIIKPGKKTELTYDSYYNPPVSDGYLSIQPSVIIKGNDQEITKDNVCKDNPIKIYDNLKNGDILNFDCDVLINLFKKLVTKSVK